MRFNVFNFQVIIPVTWVFAVIFNLPLYVVKDVVKTVSGNSCVSLWPEGWMGKAYSVTWLVVVFVSVAVMAILYSRVVHNLWFKRNDNNQPTRQQKVIKCCVISPCRDFRLFPQVMRFPLVKKNPVG